MKKVEFQYDKGGGARLRVTFDSIKKKKLTVCQIKFYDHNIMYQKIRGLAFCMPIDKWDDKEGRKWAFIDAIKCAFPEKEFREIRQTLQKEYVKMEKELEANGK